MPESAARPAPGLPRRLAAMFYDTLLLIPMLMLCVALALGIRQCSGGADGEALPGWIVQSLAALCCVGFFAGFWLKGGQTLGMQAWRIKLTPMPGKELSVARAVTRCAAALLSLACLGLGYLWCLVDRRRHSWHDYLSGTQLVLLPKNTKTGNQRADSRGDSAGLGARSAGAAQKQQADQDAQEHGQDRRVQRRKTEHQARRPQ